MPRKSKFPNGLLGNGLTPAQNQTLKEIAKVEGKTVKFLVRQAVKDFIRKKGGGPNLLGYRPSEEMRKAISEVRRVADEYLENYDNQNQSD